MHETFEYRNGKGEVATTQGVRCAFRGYEKFNFAITELPGGTFSVTELASGCGVWGVERKSQEEALNTVFKKMNGYDPVKFGEAIETYIKSKSGGNGVRLNTSTRLVKSSVRVHELLSDWEHRWKTKCQNGLKSQVEAQMSRTQRAQACKRLPLPPAMLRTANVLYPLLGTRKVAVDE